MSLTREESKLLEQRETVLSDAERTVIDETIERMEKVAKRLQVDIAGDDRTARLEAALVRLLLESRAADPANVIAETTRHRLMLNKVSELGGSVNRVGDDETLYSFPTPEAQSTFFDWLAAQDKQEGGAA